jgi:HD-GYP domain-containing protein (c-di-GMP phosphodiesterase class II)
LAELLAALSLAADLGTGAPMETTLRVCLLATRLARAVKVGGDDLAATYYTGLLWSAGCTATAHEGQVRFGDDIGLNRAMAGADFTQPTDVLRRAARIGENWGVAGRIQGIRGLLRYGQMHGEDVAAFHCEAAARLASRLGLGGSVLDGLAAFFEYWNGTGGPRKLGGQQIPFPARAARLAYEVVQASRVETDPLVVLGSRAGGELDPLLWDSFQQHATELLAGLGQESIWSDALDAEPEPRAAAPLWHVDAFASAFGDFVDLKSVYWLGHSSASARLAEAAARYLGMPEADTALVSRAAHLHGLGRVAVSNRIWDKSGSLSPAEWERVRLYPYFTDRVLSRAANLTELVRIASGAQERLDGTGYHRGLPAAAQPMTQRVVAAAASFQSMTEDRRHRPRLSSADAVLQLRAEAADGRLDKEAVAAVLEATGHRGPRTDWPNDLTDREVEVLRLVARGHTNRQVATALTISEETARNHVKHIYTKIGISTRAGAALFAMERGLFLPDK